MRRRHKRLALIALSTVLFLTVSAVLARALSEPGAERDEITTLVQAEARGDAAAMLDRLQSCRASAACTSRVREDIAALMRPGTVSILALDTSTGFALGGGVGTARVAWKTPASLPIVQCVRVRRTGNALTGLHVELLEISRRIPSASDCPRTY
jgi:hypothetical protein